MDFEIIESFIMHYQFASELLNGFVKGMVPEGCAIEIQPLEGEPFFNYALDFLLKLKYSNDLKPFKNDYKKLMLRTFNYDVQSHNRLQEAAKSFDAFDQTKTLSDYEIFEATRTDVEDIRRFVLNQGVPFSIDSYLPTINKIYIETSVLKKNLESYQPESWEKININRILELIQKKVDSVLEEEKFLKKTIKQSGLMIGYYILVEDIYYKNNAKIGLIKALSLGHDRRLKISYNVLKKNFKESMMNLQTTDLENISHILEGSQTDIITKMSFIPKGAQIELFRNECIKNPHYKRAKDKRRY